MTHSTRTNALVPIMLILLALVLAGAPAQSSAQAILRSHGSEAGPLSKTEAYHYVVANLGDRPASGPWASALVGVSGLAQAIADAAADPGTLHWILMANGDYLVSSPIDVSASAIIVGGMIPKSLDQATCTGDYHGIYSSVEGGLCRGNPHRWHDAHPLDLWLPDGTPITSGTPVYSEGARTVLFTEDVLDGLLTISADQVTVRDLDLMYLRTANNSDLEGTGISVEDGIDGIEITENIIQGFGDGIRVDASFSGSLSISRNDLMYCENAVLSYPRSSGGVVISGNHITDNSNGVLWAPERIVIPRLGTPPDLEGEQNEIFRNGCNLKMSGFYANPWSVSSNYWGTTDADEIAESLCKQKNGSFDVGAWDQDYRFSPLPAIWQPSGSGLSVTTRIPGGNAWFDQGRITVSQVGADREVHLYLGRSRAILRGRGGGPSAYFQEPAPVTANDPQPCFIQLVNTETRGDGRPWGFVFDLAVTPDPGGSTEVYFHLVDAERAFEQNAFNYDYVNPVVARYETLPPGAAPQSSERLALESGERTIANPAADSWHAEHAYLGETENTSYDRETGEFTFKKSFTEQGTYRVSFTLPYTTEDLEIFIDTIKNAIAQNQRSDTHIDLLHEMDYDTLWGQQAFDPTKPTPHPVKMFRTTSGYPVPVLRLAADDSSVQPPTSRAWEGIAHNNDGEIVVFFYFGQHNEAPIFYVIEGVINELVRIFTSTDATSEYEQVARSITWYIIPWVNPEAMLGGAYFHAFSGREDSNMSLFDNDQSLRWSKELIWEAPMSWSVHELVSKRFERTSVDPAKDINLWVRTHGEAWIEDVQHRQAADTMCPLGVPPFPEPTEPCVAQVMKRFSGPGGFLFQPCVPGGTWESWFTSDVIAYNDPYYFRNDPSPPTPFAVIDHSMYDGVQLDDPAHTALDERFPCPNDAPNGPQTPRSFSYGIWYAGTLDPATTRYQFYAGPNYSMVKEVLRDANGDLQFENPTVPTLRQRGLRLLWSIVGHDGCGAPSDPDPPPCETYNMMNGYNGTFPAS